MIRCERLNSFLCQSQKKSYTKTIILNSCLWSNFICTLWHRFKSAKYQNMTKTSFSSINLSNKPLLTLKQQQTLNKLHNISQSTVSVVATEQGDRSCQSQHLLYNFEFVCILISSKSSNHQVLTVRITGACLLPDLVNQLWETEKKLKWEDYNFTTWRNCI